MKKVILSLAVIALVGFTSCKNDKENNTDTSDVNTEMNEIAMTETTFGVRGNCGMCKNTIEEAANSVEGVNSANWSVDLKKIDIKYDDTKTDEMAIHNAIAASGYDTEKVEGNMEAYKDLPECCQYDHAMEMSLDKAMEGTEDNHHH